MKSESDFWRKSVIVAFILASVFTPIIPALSSPHHIICEKREYKAKASIEAKKSREKSNGKITLAEGLT